MSFSTCFCVSMLSLICVCVCVCEVCQVWCWLFLVPHESPVKSWLAFPDILVLSGLTVGSDRRFADDPLAVAVLPVMEPAT